MAVEPAGISSRLAKLAAALRREGVECGLDQLMTAHRALTVVAHENGEVRGSASLIPHDMDTRMELTPWLAGVFVAPEHRRRGIGAALVRRIMAEASRLNVPVLYLYTVHSETFYADLGWSLQEHTTYREQNIAIMNCRSTPTQP